jgi:cardiolipin synthase A/B
MMTVIKIILIFLLFLLAWLPVDFLLGRKKQLQQVKQRKMPLRKGEISLITSGDTLYKMLFQEIEQAKTHVHILFYIVKNDQVSQHFLSLLKKKAEEGVEVRLLLDRIGSYRLSRKMIQSLRASGVHFSFCHKIKFPFLFYSLNERNHRKITVIDGKIGYLGGFNIGKEYLGFNEELGNWRDYHLRIEGEGVQDLQAQFLHDWYDDTRELLLEETKYFPSLSKGTMLHEFIPTDGAYLKQTFLELIHQAKSNLFIGTPYFVPDNEITKALLHAIKRGVIVTILVPLKADHPLVREAEFPSFRRLLAAGCHLYHYKAGFFHAKVILVDDTVCDIGTANFDLRSLFLNHEMNCLIYDKVFIKHVQTVLSEDLRKCDKVPDDYFLHLSRWEKIKEQLAKAFSMFI